MKKPALTMVLITILILTGAFAAVAYGQSDRSDLTGVRVGILIINQFEADEVVIPLEYFRERGATVTVIGNQLGPIQAWINSPALQRTIFYGEKAPQLSGVTATTVNVDCLIEDCDPAALDCLIIPSKLRNGSTDGFARRMIDELQNPGNKASELISQMVADSKPIGASNYGPLALAAVDALKDRAVTGNWSIGNTLTMAGALYREAGVIVDGNLVTAAGPGDMPTYVANLAKLLANHAGD